MNKGTYFPKQVNSLCNFYLLLHFAIQGALSCFAVLLMPYIAYPSSWHHSVLLFTLSWSRIQNCLLKIIIKHNCKNNSYSFSIASSFRFKALQVILSSQRLYLAAMGDAWRSPTFHHDTHSSPSPSEQSSASPGKKDLWVGQQMKGSSWKWTHTWREELSFCLFCYRSEKKLTYKYLISQTWLKGMLTYLIRWPSASRRRQFTIPKIPEFAQLVAVNHTGFSEGSAKISYRTNPKMFY